jgi:TPR repeat protein
MAAFKWFKKAADLGEVRAQVSLAIFYYFSSGDKSERSLCVEWLRRAAERWYLQAQYLLALCYLDGRGVPKDAIEADKWAIIASEKGDKYSTALCSAIKNSDKLTAEQKTDAKQRAEQFVETNRFSPPGKQWPDVINIGSLFKSTNAPGAKL